MSDEPKPTPPPPIKPVKLLWVLAAFSGLVLVGMGIVFAFTSQAFDEDEWQKLTGLAAWLATTIGVIVGGNAYKQHIS